MFTKVKYDLYKDSILSKKDTYTKTLQWKQNYAALHF